MLYRGSGLGKLFPAAEPIGVAAQKSVNAGELKIGLFSLELCLHTDELPYSIIPSNLPLRSYSVISFLLRNAYIFSAFCCSES